MRNPIWKGLRAIELLIMLSLFCIVIAVFYSRYEKFACRSMQSEVKFALNQIYLAQEKYHEHYHRYAQMDFWQEKDAPRLWSQNYYQFSDAMTPNKHHFKIKAQGKNNTLVSGEVWFIDENKNIFSKRSDCELISE